MSYTFIESLDFTKVVDLYFGNDEAYADFQSELADQPTKGAVIAGATPLRKIRWQDKRRGTGKRSGLRIIYIQIFDCQVIFLLDVYTKDEADDLSKDEKRELRNLANELTEELRSRNY